MKSHLIGYELNTPGEDCSDLIAAIEKLSDTHRRCLHSTWIIKLDCDVADIRDALTPHMHASDQLLVAELSGQGAWKGFNGECSDWLVDNF